MIAAINVVSDVTESIVRLRIGIVCLMCYNAVLTIAIALIWMDRHK